MQNGFFYFSAMKQIKLEQLSKIGFINRTHGYKGMLHCVTQLANPEKLLQAEYLFVLINGLPVPYFVEDIEVNETDFFVKLEDINSDVDGKKLNSLELYAEKIREKKQNAFLSWKDLKGFTATDESYGEMGIIIEVAEYPMQYVAKCLIDEKEVLFPLNENVIKDIDEDNKTIHLDLPDGLIQLYLD